MGKTCIMKRFVENVFNEQNKATIGTAYMTKRLVRNNVSIVFQVHIYIRKCMTRSGIRQVRRCFDPCRRSTIKVGFVGVMIFRLECGDPCVRYHKTGYF